MVRKDKVISLRISPDLHSAVEKAAKRAGLSTSNYIRSVLAIAAGLIPAEAVKLAPRG